MTIIVYHQGVLYADDCVVCPFPNEHVKTKGKKIHVSKCERFALAFSGALPCEANIAYIEQFFLQHLNIFYQDPTKQVPMNREDLGQVPMLIHPVLVMTKQHVWYMAANKVVSPTGSIIMPVDGDVPVCMGSGTDALLSMWALEIPIESALAKVHYYDSNCSNNITVVKRESLKDFTYVKAKDDQPSGTDQEQHADTSNGVSPPKRQSRTNRPRKPVNPVRDTHPA